MLISDIGVFGVRLGRCAGLWRFAACSRGVVLSSGRRVGEGLKPYTCRSTIMRLISAIAFAGFKCFGHALAQFMMVWQR